MSEFLEFDKGSHRYFADAIERPSVTQILKATGITSEFAVDSYAAERGRLVHHWAAEDDRKKVDMRKVPKHIRGWIESWRNWRSVASFVPELIEHRVDSPALGYSGCLDRVGVRGLGIPVIVDLKTSMTGAVPDSTRLQLTAYAYALGRGHIERMGVGLRPDGRFSVKLWGVETYSSDVSEWIRLVHTYHSLLDNNNGLV